MQGSSLINSSPSQSIMTLLVQNLLKDDEFHSLEVETDITLEDFKCLLEIESQIPVSDQVLFFKNQELTQDQKKLVDFGVTNNDMISLTKSAGVIKRGGGGNLNQNDQNLLNNFFTSLQKDVSRIPKMNFNQMFNQLFHNQQNQMIKREAEKIKQIWNSDPHYKTQLKNNNPELAQALETGNQNLVEKLIGKTIKDQMENRKKEQERMARLMNADPNDEEAQKMIEEEIRKQMIEQNYINAQENYPEFFGHIHMLYVDVFVNKHPIQAFVDSGAQATIISKKCAQECGIMHLLDIRFAGMAVGVGSSRILGRIHLADLEIGGVVLQCSFTVLEDNKVDLLFGLDNLKRHQCCIDLVSNKLHIKNGEISVPFLADGEIKKKEIESESDHDIQGSFKDTDIKELMDMGFTKSQVKEALSVCDGNREKAANYLMSQK